MSTNAKIEAAKEKFGELLEEQLKRVEQMNENKEPYDFEKLNTIIVGVAGGDGIGPAITAQGKRIMEFFAEGAVGKRKNPV